VKKAGIGRIAGRGFTGFQLVAAGLLALVPARPLAAQEVRRALPVGSTPPPAIPVESGKPEPTPAPEPKPTPAPDEIPDVNVAPPPPAADSNAKSADVIQLDFANSFYARKMWDMAAPEYEKYLATYLNTPARQAAQFRLGECYRMLGDLNAAKLAYRTVIDNFAMGEFIGPAAYRLGEMYLQEKDYTGAENAFRRASIRVKDPLLANSAKFHTARCLEKLKRPLEARMVYEDLASAKESNPFRDASRFSMAQILSDAGRKEEALKTLELAGKETASPALKAEAAVKAALLQIDLNQPEKAAGALERALQIPEIGPWREVAQLGLLRVLYETGKYKQMLDQYNAAAGSFPADAKPEILLLAANANRQLKKYDLARPLYEQVIHDYPDSVYASEARYERLIGLYTANDPNLVKEADDYLAQNLEPQKHDQVMLLKAEALYKNKDYAGAATVYSSIGNSRLMPAFKAEALFKLGWCSMQMKDTARALAAYTDFIDLYPTHKLMASALAQRAIAHQQTKNFDAALKDFNQLITRYPQAREREFALQQKALTLGQQQDNAGMIEAFRQLLKEYPKSKAAGQANYWIGWCAFENKDYKNAVPPLDAARKADREQFFERATLRVMLAHYYLEERDPLAAEVDVYTKAGGRGKVPAEVLRWLGQAYFNDKKYAQAGKYLAILVSRPGEAVADDRLNLGRSQLKLEQYGEAEKTMRVYLESVHRPFARATGLLVLGSAQLALNQLDDAQKSADEACGLQPEGRLNAEGRMLSGDIQMARINYSEAAKLFQSVSVVFDDPEITPQALEKAVVALKAAGKDSESAKMLNTLQSRYPEFQLKLTPHP
jgi:TolA-binding protein